MKINLIGAGSDLGVSKDGADLGPGRLLKYYEKDTRINKIIEINKSKDIIKSYDKKDLEKNLNEINEFNKRLYDEVLATKEDNILPVIIGGDHSIAIASTLASIKKEKQLGVIWFDAHGDYNTFETTRTGNLHGLPLATTNGLTKKLNPYHDGPYYKSENTLILGGRDIDSWEWPVINDNNVKVFSSEELKENDIKEIVKESIKRVTNNFKIGFHMSFDIDVIDPEDAPGVSVPAINGISKNLYFKIVDEILLYKDYIKSIDIVEYNPTFDDNDKTLNIAHNTLEKILRTFL